MTSDRTNKHSSFWVSAESSIQVSVLKSAWNESSSYLVSKCMLLIDFIYAFFWPCNFEVITQSSCEKTVFSLMTYTGLLQSFSWLELCPFLAIDCKFSFTSASIRLTTNAQNHASPYIVFFFLLVFHLDAHHNMEEMLATFGLRNCIIVGYVKKKITIIQNYDFHFIFQKSLKKWQYKQMTHWIKHEI